MNSLVKKILNIILRISISFALLTFIFRKVDKDQFLEIIRTADLRLLILTFFIFTSSFVIGLLRWRMLLKCAQVHLKFRRILFGYCGGLFFNLFLPSTIGGDLVRGFDLASHSKKPKEVVASVLLDRLSGYIALATVAVLALFIGFRIIQDRTVVILVAMMVVLLASALLVLFNNFLFSKLNNLLRSFAGNRLLTVLKDLHQEIYYFREHKKMIFSNLGLSFIIQVCFPLIFYLTARSLGVDIRLIYFFIFVPLITIISFLPISIGGLGLRDATTVYFFAKAGLDQGVSLAISLIIFAMFLIVGCIGGIVYVFTLHTRRLQPDKKL